MILPGKDKFEGVIGTTWDQVFVLFPATYGFVEWADRRRPEWKSTTTYKLNQGVLGSDGNAYYALKENLGKDPTTNIEGNWQKMVPINNTGFTGEFFCSKLQLKVGEGITLGGAAGTVLVKATPIQTKEMPEGNQHFGLVLKDTEGNEYEYSTGHIKWASK